MHAVSAENPARDEVRATAVEGTQAIGRPVAAVDLRHASTFQPPPSVSHRHQPVPSSESARVPQTTHAVTLNVSGR